MPEDDLLELDINGLQDSEEVQPKFTLTEGQASAIDELSAWYGSKEQNIVVSGSPGTGKTFLAKFFVNSLPSAVPLFTAPTNEAVRQLELSLKGAATTKTTYSALGLKLSMSSYKQKIYQSKLPEDFDDYNLLVVDESSMAGKQDEKMKDSYKLLMDYVAESGMRTIWLGDWAQLPPVESETGTSPVFDAGYKTLELTQVKRHAGDILDFAIELRSTLLRPIRNLPEKIPAGIGQRQRTSSGMADFTLEEFEEIIQDKARIITWTNQVTKFSRCPGVSEYNFNIRSRLFGAERAAEQLVWPTDKILFATPLFSIGNIQSLKLETLMDTEFEMVASVNTKAEVVSLEKAVLMGVECHKALLELEGGVNRTAYIPTNAGEETKKRMEAEFRQIAIDAGGGRASGKAWEYYHTFRQLFADIKHTYCITSHRAQGSTIPRVYVDVPNILQNRNRLVAFKSLYVGATRAAEQLDLIR
jgi:hypothetical protein